MPAAKDVKNARRQAKIAKIENITTRKLDQTANIKDRKSAKLGNIAARRIRKDVRTARGQGQAIASQVLGVVDDVFSEMGETLRDPDYGKNVAAVGEAIVPFL